MIKRLFIVLSILVLFVVPIVGHAAVSGTNLTSGGNENDPTGQTSFTTGSVSPTSNNLVLASFAVRHTATSLSPAVSGCGLTWVQVALVRYDNTSTYRTLAVFRALGASPTSGALTISFGANSVTAWTYSIDQFSGIDTSGTNGSGAIVQAVTNYWNPTSSSPVTVTLSAFGSSTNATYGVFSEHGFVSSIGTGTGFSSLSSNVTSYASSYYLIQSTEWKNSADTTVDMTLNYTGSEVGGIGIEIKEYVAAGGAPEVNGVSSSTEINGVTNSVNIDGAGS